MHTVAHSLHSSPAWQKLAGGPLLQPLGSVKHCEPARTAILQSPAVACSATGQMAGNRQRLSVAPMMDWTDVHYRQLARIISRHTWLWTEMVVDKTIIHTTLRDKHLWFPPEQRPIVCQMGGSDPETLAKAAVIVAEYGYDEINLNCGCPSDRVAGAGCFGASLMLQPQLVATCMKAMGEAVAGTPVTVKCRLGVDHVDSYESLCTFIRTVSEGSPVRHFIIHARKCMLKGLNPHQNRTIPPLRYEWVYALKQDFPHLTFSLNGGIQTCHQAKAAIQYTGPFTQPASTNGHMDVELPPNAFTGVATAAAAAAAMPTAAVTTAAAPDALHPASGSHDNGTVPAQCDTETAGPDATASVQAVAPDAAAGPTCSPHNPAVAMNGCGRMTEAEDLAAPAAASVSPRCQEAAAASTSHDATTSTGGAHELIEGVMIGRAAYNDPWGCLSDADRAVFGAASNAAPNRRYVLQEYIKYADMMIGRWSIKPDGRRDPGVRTLFKPLLGLFHSERGSKQWKAAVDGLLQQNPAMVSEVISKTIHLIPDEVLDAPPKQTHELPSFTLGPLPQPTDTAGLPKGAAAASSAPILPAKRAASGQQKAQCKQQQQQQQQQAAQQPPVAAAAAAATTGANGLKELPQPVALEAMTSCAC